MATGDSGAAYSVLLRVLVATPGRLVNEGLTALLSEFAGISVFGCAQDPPRVLALVRTVHPDVVILELQVAAPTGIQLLKQIGELPAAPMVIVLSDNDAPPIREAAVAAGATHHLARADIEGLQQVLGDLLRQREAR